MNNASNLEIIYIGDPMCSWCWGFAPVLEEMVADYGAAAGFHAVVGGLRPGPAAQPMNEELKAYLRTHWQHVQEATGQPFNFEFLERDGFLYDTEPAARAVVAVRTIMPEKTFPFFKALQAAFYQDNIDITNEQNYGPLLHRLEIDEDLFYATYHTEENRRATYEDFGLVQKWGIQGFPATVLRNQDRLGLLSVGYQPYPVLAPVIAQFFEIPLPVQ